MSTATLDKVSANGNSRSLGEDDQTWHPRCLLSPESFSIWGSVHKNPRWRGRNRSLLAEPSVWPIDFFLHRWRLGGGFLWASSCFFCGSSGVESSIVWNPTSPAVIFACYEDENDRVNSNWWQSVLVQDVGDKCQQEWTLCDIFMFSRELKWNSC